MKKKTTFKLNTPELSRLLIPTQMTGNVNAFNSAKQNLEKVQGILIRARACWYQ